MHKQKLGHCDMVLVDILFCTLYVVNFFLIWDNDSRGASEVEGECIEWVNVVAILLVLNLPCYGYLICHGMGT